MKRLATAALIVGGLLAASVSTAGAATLTYSPNGSVSGILGLSVDTQIYDVAFLYGSYETVYTTAATFANAALIMDTINVELNTPCSTGCSIAIPSGTPVDYRVPVSQVISSEISYYTAGVDPFTGLWRRQLAPPGPFTISSTAVSTMWAQVTPVPLPAALPLLLSALGFFGFFGWRRKRLAARPL